MLTYNQDKVFYTVNKDIAMPSIPAQETIVQYQASSLQLAYTFAFYAPEETDIQVFYQASTATPVPDNDILTLNVDYTVSYNADPITGGTITLLFTPTTGYYLTINRLVLASLDTQFSDAQNFNGANLDAALDRLLLLCQQNQNYILQRNLSYIINTYLPDAQPYTQLPPLEQNQFWVGSGSGVVAATIDTVPSASVLQSMLENASPGTDGARIVGYYDAVNAVSTTVQAFLADIVPFIKSELATQLAQPGDMKAFGGGALPDGWLLCDGSAVSRTTYADLFAVIGETWGVGDGSTTFNLPDISRRTLVGSGGTGTVTLGDSVGDTGGAEEYTLVANDLPAHSHGFSVPFATQAASRGAGGADTVTNSSSHSGTTSNNVTSNNPVSLYQPSAVVLMIIKY
jgi:microcystin-dependent protein